MYTLLAICLVLHPQRIDESLHSMLKEKNYAEKMNKMSQGDLSEFEASFNFACPKFLSPVPPSFDVAIGVDVASLHKEPLRLQMNVFMDEVKQQLLLPTIRYIWQQISRLLKTPVIGARFPILILPASTVVN
jgi:translation initiation factor 3 subunit L